MGAIILFLVAIGIMYLLIRTIIYMIKKNIKERKNITYVENFPTDDGNGNKALVLQEEIKLTGTTMIHGNNPQYIIPKKRKYEEVFFKRVSYDDGKFPYATKVVDSNGYYLGWLPDGSKIQEDVAKRLDNNEKVYGRVNNTFSFESYEDEDKDIWGIEIDVQKFSKVKSK